MMYPDPEKNSRKRIQKSLETINEMINKFLNTTAGTITSFTLLLGAISSLTLAIVASPIPPKDACSESIKSIEHLVEEPLKTLTYEIKKPDVSIDMEITIYENGDILTTYGRSRKWLCFPEVIISIFPDSLVNFLIPQAVAQTIVPNVQGRTTYIQEQTLSPNSRFIEQTRIYSDGTVKKTRIDLQKGIIVDENISAITITPELQKRLDRGIEVEETTIIHVRSK